MMWITGYMAHDAQCLSLWAQVCVDLFVMAQSYVDVASLKELCHHTAGSLYHYQPFHALADADQFWNDFHWSVVRPQVCAHT